MERCPGCRARYKGEPICHRCGADLTLALQAEVDADASLGRAVKAFSAGDQSAADRALEVAIALHLTPLALALKAFFEDRRCHQPERVRHALVQLKDAPDESLLSFWSLFRHWLAALLRPVISTCGSSGLVESIGQRARPHLFRQRLKKLIGPRVVPLVSWLTQSSAENEISDKSRLMAVIQAIAAEIHQTMGSGLPEQLYEECLCRALSVRTIPFQRQVPIPVIWQQKSVDSGFRINLLVAEQLMVVIEGAESRARTNLLLNYLHQHGWQSGVVINFNIAPLYVGARHDSTME